MAKTQTAKFKQTVNAPAAQAYRAFTNSTALREWMCDGATADARKGGRLYVWWNDGYTASGEFTTLTLNKKVAFTWRGRGEPDATKVQVSLAEKNGSTVVTVTHSGFGSGKAWAKAVKELTGGWEYAMENLASVLGSGPDLRIATRPMLGIMVDAFDAEIAKKIGVPVADGLRLSGTLEGMGARAAGLQKDDVIVSLGGKKVTGNTLAGALQGRRGGDTVPVVFYRGQEKQKVMMQLSRRPLPEIPATAGQLAEAVSKMYAELDVELAKCFEGVTEEEASFKPTPDEWSAKDVLAHLLAGERDGHSFITEAIDGVGRWYDGFGGNVEARHTAVIAAYPTVQAMLEEYRRNEIETV
ncbi:MAG: SRPBCC domain-containing protein, partial [Chloroflexota bacterium]